MLKKTKACLLFVVGVAGYHQSASWSAVQRVQAEDTPAFTLTLKEVIKDQLSGQQVAESVGMKSTGAPWPPATIEKFKLSRPMPGHNCMADGMRQQTFNGYKVVGRELLGGLLTVKMIKEDPNPIEAWHALDLNCEEIQHKIGFNGCCENNELRFVSFTWGEPDPHMFDVLSFKEATPGEAAITMARLAGFPASHLKKMAIEYRSIDKSYWQTRETAGVRP